jgi:hypothetical protein
MDKKLDPDKIREEMERCKNSPKYFFDNYCNVSADEIPITDPEVIKEIWDAARPVLSNADKKIIITSTPTGGNFFYDLYIKSKK